MIWLLLGYRQTVIDWGVTHDAVSESVYGNGALAGHVYEWAVLRRVLQSVLVTRGCRSITDNRHCLFLCIYLKILIFYVRIDRMEPSISVIVNKDN